VEAGEGGHQWTVQAFSVEGNGAQGEGWT
jgi:hypothetical protein